MLQRLEGVVLHVVKYSDKSNIVHIYTRENGSMSFLIPAARSRKSLVNGVSSAFVGGSGGRRAFTHGSFLGEGSPVGLSAGVCAL